MTYLDNGHDKASYIVELGHINGKVLELVLLGLFQDEFGAFADGIDAAQVAGGVEGWIWSFGERDIWEARGP